MKENSKKITRRSFIGRTGAVAAGLTVFPGSVVSGCGNRAPSPQDTTAVPTPAAESEAIAGTRMRVDWQGMISRHNIDLPQLPENHTDSLRLGNGDIGVAVYATPECLVLFVGKNDLLDYRTKPGALSPEATAASVGRTPMPTTKPAGWNSRRVYPAELLGRKSMKL